MSETKLYLDIDDQAKYFVESTGCSVDQANLYIEGEEEYLASILVDTEQRTGSLRFLKRKQHIPLLISLTLRIISLSTKA